MKSSDLKREENYDEYLRLSQNEDYVDVTFDEESGGVSAVHRLHKFDKQMGAYGMRRGEYEIVVARVLRKSGHSVILESELSSGQKKCDGLLDDTSMEIKAVEGNGTWTISSALRAAHKQRAKCVVLFFPKQELYSENRISEGLRLAKTNPGSGSLEFSRLLVVVCDRVVFDQNESAIGEEP